MMSHFAISIEKPAIPLAPNMYAMSANIRKNIASPIKPAIFHSPTKFDRMRINSLRVSFRFYLFFLYIRGGIDSVMSNGNLL
jgi:hypothetical protein